MKNFLFYFILVIIILPVKGFGETNTRTRTSLGFAIGSIGSHGFGLEGNASLGWELGKRVSLDLQFGGGTAQERSEVGGPFVHGDVLFPVTIKICSSIPRVCPGLEFELSPTAGAGYGWFDGDHTLNVILGLSLESLRRHGEVDMGVKAAIFGYFNLLDFDQVVSLVILDLGIVIKWGASNEY